MIWFKLHLLSLLSITFLLSCHKGVVKYETQQLSSVEEPRSGDRLSEVSFSGALMIDGISQELMSAGYSLDLVKKVVERSKVEVAMAGTLAFDNPASIGLELKLGNNQPQGSVSLAAEAVAKGAVRALTNSGGSLFPAGAEESFFSLRGGLRRLERLTRFPFAHDNLFTLASGIATLDTVSLIAKGQVKGLSAVKNSGQIPSLDSEALGKTTKAMASSLFSTSSEIGMASQESAGDLAGSVLKTILTTVAESDLKDNAAAIIAKIPESVDGFKELKLPPSVLSSTTQTMVEECVSIIKTAEIKVDATALVLEIVKASVSGAYTAAASSEAIAETTANTAKVALVSFSQIIDVTDGDAQKKLAESIFTTAVKTFDDLPDWNISVMTEVTSNLQAKAVEVVSDLGLKGDNGADFLSTISVGILDSVGSMSSIENLGVDNYTLKEALSAVSEATIADLKTYFPEATKDYTSSLQEAVQKAATNTAVVNTPPKLTDVIDSRTPEDVPLTISVNISDLEIPLNCEALKVTTDNTQLLPSDAIIISGTAPNCLVDFIPKANRSGKAVVTLLLSDGFQTSTDNFILTVDPVNDNPVVAQISDQTTLEDTSVSVTLAVSDIDSIVSCQTVTAVASNTTLIPTSGVAISEVSSSGVSSSGVSSSGVSSSQVSGFGSSASCVLSLTPASNQSGSSLITVSFSDGALSHSVNFTVSVAAVNDAPTISPIPDQSMEEGTVLQNLAINFSDLDSTLDCTSLIVSSSNTSLLPASSISTVAGTYPQCNVSFSPLSEKNGLSLITVRVRDSGGLEATKTFNLTVNPVNAPPQITMISAQTLNEDSSFELPFVITDVDSNLSCSSVTVQSNVQSTQQDIFSLADLVITGTAPSCALKLSPQPNKNGLANITLSISDGQLNASSSVAVTVNAVNDPPVISQILDSTVAEDTEGSVFFYLTDIDSTVNCNSVTASSSNQTLISQNSLRVLAEATGCRLFYSPGLNQTGSSQLTLSVTDGNSSSSMTFTVVVTPVNDPPVLSQVLPQTIVNNTALQNIAFNVSDVDTPLACSAVGISSSNPNLLPASSFRITGIAPQCFLSITPFTNQNGQASITLSLSDGTLMTDSIFVVTVNAVNSPPVISQIAGLDVPEDSSSILGFTVTDSDSPIACNNVSAVSSNEAVVAQSGMKISGTAPNCLLEINPNYNQNGTSQITLTLSDGIQSANQSFTAVFRPINDPPVVSQILDFTITRGVPMNIGFSVTDPDSTVACSDVQLTINPPLVDTPQSEYPTISGTAPSCFLNINVPNSPGGSSQADSRQLTLTASDGLSQSSTSFQVTLPAAEVSLAISHTLDVVVSPGQPVESRPFALTTTDPSLACNSVAISSSNSNIIAPYTGIWITGSAPQCYLNFSPLSATSGSVQINLSVTNAAATAFDNFMVYVSTQPVNSPYQNLVIANINNQSFDEDSWVEFSFNLSGVDSSFDCNFLARSSTNQNLIPHHKISIWGMAPNCYLKVFSQPDTFGESEITLSFANGTTAAKTFLVTVHPVNDPPVFSFISSLSLNSGMYRTVEFNISDVDSTVQCANVTASSSSPVITMSSPAISDYNGSCNLNFFASTNSADYLNGNQAVITLSATDQIMSTSTNFTVNVIPANSPVGLSSVTDLTLNQGQSSQPISVTLSGVSPYLSCQSFLTGNTPPSEGAVPSISISGQVPNCFITLSAPTDRSGTFPFTLTASYAGNFASTSFSLTVSPATVPTAVGWYQEAFLKASNAEAGDGFGNDVAIAGDTAIVGARFEDSSQSVVTNSSTTNSVSLPVNNNSLSSGAVYIYGRQNSWWGQQAYLKASNSDAGDKFGSSVALSGDAAIVGAPQESSSGWIVSSSTYSVSDNNMPASGAAYIYRRSFGYWSEEAILKATNAASGQLFGSTVAISGGIAVVGAPAESSGQSIITNEPPQSSAASSGAVYVFTKNANTWQTDGYLKSSDIQSQDFFGQALAISGDTILVGSPGDDTSASVITNQGPFISQDNSLPAAGSVMVFRRINNTWQQEAYLKPSDADQYDNFGRSVAISMDTVVVGADGQASAMNTITNGSSITTDNGLAHSGASYVFHRTGNTWTQEAILKAPNVDANDHFGGSVAVHGDTVVVGSKWEASSETTITNWPSASADNSAPQSGAGYVFRRSSEGWLMEAYLKASNARASAVFGESLAISGNTILVGAQRENSDLATVFNTPLIPSPSSFAMDAGAVYVLRNNSRFFEVSQIQVQTDSTSFHLNWNHQMISGQLPLYKVVYDIELPAAGCSSGFLAYEGTDNYAYVTSAPPAGQSFIARICLNSGYGYSEGIATAIKQNQGYQHPIGQSIINHVPSQFMPLNGSLHNIAISLNPPAGTGGSDPQPNCNSITVSSSNTSLFSTNGGIVLSGSGLWCSLSLFPSYNQSGYSTITLSITYAGLTSFTNFGVDVSNQSSGIVIDPIGDQVTVEDTAAVVPFTMSQNSANAQCSHLWAGSLNPALVDPSHIMIEGTAPNCSLKIWPSLNQTGTASIHLYGIDNYTVLTSFSLTVIPVNDAPQISYIYPQSTSPNTYQTVSFSITDPDSNVSCSSASVHAYSDSPLISNSSFYVYPNWYPNSGYNGGYANCYLSFYVPKTEGMYHPGGNANITVTAFDGSSSNQTVSASRTFEVRVFPSSNSTVISEIPDQFTTYGSSSLSIPFSFSSDDPWLSCNSMTISNSMTVSSSNWNVIPLSEPGSYSITGSGGDCSLNLASSVAWQSGVTTITLNSSYGYQVSSRSFQVYVSNPSDTLQISEIDPVVISEDSQAWLPFTISGMQQGFDCRFLTVTSSNTALVSQAGISIGGTTPQCTLQIWPQQDQNGSTDLTISYLQAGSGNSAGSTKTFTLTVLPVNDAPIILPILNQTMATNSSRRVPFTVFDIDTFLSCGAPFITALSQYNIISNQAISIGGNAPNCYLDLVSSTIPWEGTESYTGINLTVSDGSSSVSTGFGVNVYTGVGPIAISDIADQTTTSGNSIYSLQFTVSSPEPSVNCWGLLVSSTNEALISPQGGVTIYGGANGECYLNLNPRFNQVGTSTITLSITNGVYSASESFTVFVAPANANLQISDIPEQFTMEDSPLGFNFWLSGNNAPFPCRSIEKTSSNSNLIPAANIYMTGYAPDCYMQIVPVANAFGSVDVTLGLSNGTTAPKTFAVHIQAIDDPPTFINDSIVTVNAGVLTSIPFTISDVDSNLGSCSSAVNAFSYDYRVSIESITGTAPQCYLNIYPPFDYDGYYYGGSGTFSTWLQLTVSDQFNTVWGGLSVYVTPQTPVLSIDAIPPQNVEPGMFLSVPITVSGFPQDIPCYFLNTTATDPNTPSMIIYPSGNSPNCQLNLTAPFEWSGDIPLTVTGTYGLYSASRAFTLSVQNNALAPSGWVMEAYIKASNAEAYDNFASSVELFGDTAIVGARLEDSAGSAVTNSSGSSSDNSVVEAGAAYIYRRSGSIWSQEQFLKAPYSDSGDQYGYSVAISGDTAIVASPYESAIDTTITNGTFSNSDNSRSSSGAAYVYKRNGSGWSEEAFIKASNAGENDLFGVSVKISGDTAIVGAQGEDGSDTTIFNGSIARDYNQSPNETMIDSGASYIFRRTYDPNLGAIWSQEAYIKASNANGYAIFGNQVFISGDTAVVGSNLESSSASTITNGTSSTQQGGTTQSGAIYLYRKGVSGWYQEAYIKPSNSWFDQFFGSSISLSGDSLMVGATNEQSSQSIITNGSSSSSDRSLNAAGAAYIFTRDGSLWSEAAYLKGSNASSQHYFGRSVAISGDTAVVGADGENSSMTTITTGSLPASTDIKPMSGAVYVFKREATGLWQSEAHIKASNANIGHSFGAAVSLSGNRIMVAAEKESSSFTTITNTTITNGANIPYSADAPDAGAVYVYRNATGLFDPSIYVSARSTTSISIRLSDPRLSNTDQNTSLLIAPISEGDATPLPCTAPGTIQLSPEQISQAMLAYEQAQTPLSSAPIYYMFQNLNPSTRYGVRVCTSRGNQVSSGVIIRESTQ